MKKLITTCIMLTAISMVTFAQSKVGTRSATKQSNALPSKTTTTRSAAPTAEQMAERRAKATMAQYALTSEQYKGVYQAELDYENQYQQAKANGYEPGPGQSMQMKMGRDQAIKNVMTPAQYAKYESAQKASN